MKISLNHKIIGEGPPVIILHGLFGMLDNWQSIAKKIAAEGYMVFIIDQRDHGKSPFTHEFNYPVLAADLATFMEENWIYKAHIIGHSMGGKTAMQFAFEHPDRIDKLVVADICNKTYPGGHEAIFDAIQKVDAAHREDRQEIYDFLKEKLHDESTIQFLLKNLQRKKEGGYEWKMNVALLQKSYQHILDKTGTASDSFQHPCLFIRGGRSPYIQPDDEAEIYRQFPLASILTIENAGHWVHAEQPEIFTGMVLDFFSENP